MSGYLSRCFPVLWVAMKPHKWINVQGRFYHASWADERFVVVAGGYQQEKVLSSTEIYDSETKKWKFTDEMPLGVGGAAFCSYKDYLFICCGQYSVRYST